MRNRVAKRLRVMAYAMANVDSVLRNDGRTVFYPKGSGRQLYQQFKREYARTGTVEIYDGMSRVARR